MTTVETPSQGLDPIKAPSSKLPQLGKGSLITRGQGFGPSSSAGKQRLGNIIVGIVLSIGGIIMIAPLLWTLSTSLKTREGVFALPLSGFQTHSSGKTTSAFGLPVHCCQVSKTHSLSQGL